MENMRNVSRGFDDGALLDAFCFSRGVLVLRPLPSPFAFACRWSIVEWRWLASLLGKADSGIACSVSCITKRLERRCFDVQFSPSRFSNGAIARHTCWRINFSGE